MTHLQQILQNTDNEKLLFAFLVAGILLTQLIGHIKERHKNENNWD